MSRRLLLAVQRKRAKLLLRICIIALLSALVSFALGDNYDFSKQRYKGEPVKSRPVRETQTKVKDLFDDRPRIATRNGHLTIQASQDKNIEFLTRGSRASIKLNGHKIDQLLEVTRALANSSLARNGDKKLGQGADYEALVSNIYDSGDRITKLEKLTQSLSTTLATLTSNYNKQRKLLAKRLRQVKSLARNQDEILAKLERNDCIDPESNQVSCKNGATCIDSYDGFKCLCPSNWAGPTCEQDVDECAKFKGTELGCQNGAKCVNLPGSYRCECNGQFYGQHCTEQHEDCSLSSSRALCGFGKCINLASSSAGGARYECRCDQGWTTDGSNPACVIDINECLAGTSVNSSLTTGSTGMLAPGSSYPCSTVPFVGCTNLPGSFQCDSCPPGYTGSGRRCFDLDECATNNGGCSTQPLVDCINTPGSRQCAPCPPGYSGDGVICSKVSACQQEPNGGCNPMARCVDLPAVSADSRLCICKYPLQGDGIGPYGCKLGTLIANSDQSSSRNSSSVALANEASLESPREDCQPNPCLNGAACRDGQSSFECICKPGWMGRKCELELTSSSICGANFDKSAGNITFTASTTVVELVKDSPSTASAETSSDDVLPFQTSRYNCSWSISVASNMSIKLNFSKLINKRNQSVRVQVYVATKNRHLKAPDCSESLDIREPTPISEPSEPISGRLMARICAWGSSRQLPGSPSQSVALQTEFNAVRLEYSFAVMRTQTGQPGMQFELNWQQVDPGCGGFLPVADSGSVSSPQFPNFYEAGMECRYLIRVPDGKRIRVQFGELNLLTPITSRQRENLCADSLTILEGSLGSDRPVLFQHCANNITLMNGQTSYPPIISSSSSVEVILLSQRDSMAPLMRPRQKRGFYLTYASEPSLECGPNNLYVARSAFIRSADYESLPELSDTPEIANALSLRIREFEKQRKSQKTSRCEYEIKPTGPSRNMHVEVDMVEMVGAPKDGLDRVLPWLRCARARLRVYDGQPNLVKSNLLASFCWGDSYNSTDSRAIAGAGDRKKIVTSPIISSGHSIFLVYESRSIVGKDDESVRRSQLRGFKLHYSSVCSATHFNLSGRFQVDLDTEISECTHHLVLPANNTISLVLATQMSDSLLLSNGSCAAEAIFLDGATTGTTKQLLEVGRVMHTYQVPELPAVVDGNDRANLSVENRSGATHLGLSEVGDKSSDKLTANYWQYSSSQAHDIKQMDVCRLSNSLGFDSIWNHMSLLFRLTESALRELPKGSKVQLVIRYQAEPSCGGIISEPLQDSLRLTAQEKVTSLRSYPITLSKYEQLHSQSFVNVCAWILRNPIGRSINVRFSIPREEIKKRYDDWLAWAHKRASNSTDNEKVKFLCNQVFSEQVELFEPVQNRTRWLCPNELMPVPTTVWLTNGNVLYIRLHNNTDQTSDFPGRKPLLGSISAEYKFLKADSKPEICGGRLVSDSGVIRSPEFPDNYPPLAACNWLIQASPNQQIRLNFTAFSLERQNKCRFDYLEIRNGPTVQSPLIGRFCNIDLQGRVIISHTNFVFLIFRSDSFLSQRGFEVHFDGAQWGCGGRLRSPTGDIASPNYPRAIAHSSSCEWLIETSESSRIQANFSDLDLSRGSKEDCKSLSGSADYVEIISSDLNKASRRSLGKFCHKGQLGSSGTLTSSSNSLSVVFQSQALDEGHGFHLTYRTICKGIELVGLSGAIESPGFPQGYMDNFECGWLIRGPLGSNLTFTLTDLSLEKSAETTWPSTNGTQHCSEDFLQIWSIDPSKISEITSVDKLLINASIYKNLNHKDSRETYGKSGIPLSGSLVMDYCGSLDEFSLAERTITLNGSHLAYIRFETDASVSSSGFRLEWKAVTDCGFEQKHDGLSTTFGASSALRRINFRESDLFAASTSGGKLLTPIGARECFWLIDQADVASRLELHLHSDMRILNGSAGSNPTDSCQDASLAVYDGLSDREQILTKNCGILRPLETVTTSTGRALIRFYTSGRHNFGREFTLSAWTGSNTNCFDNDLDIMAGFNRIAGSKASPNYPDLYESKVYSCYSLLSAHTGRLLIRVEELNLPHDESSSTSDASVTQLGPSETCKRDGNFLLLRGESDRLSLEYLCGQMGDKKRELVFERETVSIEFVASGPYKGRWRISYMRLCGSLLRVSYPRDISTPDYPDQPKWPDESNSDETLCIWRLKSNVRDSPSGDERLVVDVINFVASDKPGDCLRVYEGVSDEQVSLRQSKFNLTDMDNRLQARLKICKQSDLKYSTLSYMSLGNELLVVTSGSVVVKLRVRPIDNHCGGEYRLASAEFASPSYPRSYTSNLDCLYHIVGSPGSKINLKFTALDLPEPDPLDSDGTSSGCDNVDHLEIRQIFLERPAKALASERFLISGKSSATNSRLKELSNLYYTYNKLPTLASRLRFHLIDTSINLDDFYDTSNLLGKFCGKQLPQDLTSSLLNEQVLVRFRSYGGQANTTDSIRQPTGFLASYSIMYGGLISLTGADGTGLISSPGYPARSRYNGSIRWTLIAPINKSIQFDMVELDLGSIYSECSDSLEIYDGLSPERDARIAQLCGQLKMKLPDLHTSADPIQINLAQDPTVQKNLVRSMTTSSNAASVVYKNSLSSAAFLLRYRVVDPDKAKSNDLAEFAGYANVTGRKLDDSADEQFLPSMNASLSCSKVIKLSLNTNFSTTELTSPFWPLEPPSTIECHWVLATSDNTNIKLAIDPQPWTAASANLDADSDSTLDGLKSKADCLKAGSYPRNLLVVHAGASKLAPILLRHCLPAPPLQVISSGRQMLVRYIADGGGPSGKFKAVASVNECGGQYYVNQMMSVADRLANSGARMYSNNLMCRYILFAPSIDQRLMIHSTLSTLDLAQEPSDKNCSRGDYIEIRELPLLSESFDYALDMVERGPRLGRFCARNPLVMIESSGSALVIDFKTDAANTGKGWTLQVSPTLPRPDCPRSSERLYLSADNPYGRIVSPNWPHGFMGTRRCRYYVAGPLDKRLELRYVRLDRAAVAGKVKTCADNLTVLADNEVSWLQYSSRPLREAVSPLSGALLRKLVQDGAPCSTVYNSPSKIMALLPANRPVSGMGRLNLTEYTSLLEMIPPILEPLVSSSYRMILEYEGRDLKASEGFFAIVRAVDLKGTEMCGGLLDLGKGVTSIQSARFNQLMESSDKFIQCDWEIPQDWPDLLFASSFGEIAFQDNYAPMYSQNRGQSKSLTSAFLVFNVLEIPSSGDGVYDETLALDSKPRDNEICGLNRLVISDGYTSSSLLTCGNQTAARRWLLLDANAKKISLRTKNLRQGSVFHRGLRAFLYERQCPPIDSIEGKTVRIRSHLEANSSYSPTICKWQVRVRPGQYAITFTGVKLRGNNASNSSVGIANCDQSQDQLEIRASSESDAPILVRVCAQNQDWVSKQRLVFDLQQSVGVLFLAGLDRLANGTDKFEPDPLGANGFGFEMLVQQVRNQSEGEFCHRQKGANIYRLIQARQANSEALSSWARSISARPVDFLYPKNVHCVVLLEAEPGVRFNFTFWGLFDLEKSPDCRADYLQIEDLPERGQVNVTKPSAGVGEQSLLVGRWCGKQRPPGSFLSRSSRVQIIFHTNERIQGRGFQLEYRQTGRQSLGS